MREDKIRVTVHLTSSLLYESSILLLRYEALGSYLQLVSGKERHLVMCGIELIFCTDKYDDLYHIINQGSGLPPLVRAGQIDYNIYTHSISQ